MTSKTRVTDIEQQLWSAADELRANSNLSAQQYSVPVLGLIFLRYADAKFGRMTTEIEAELAEMSERRRARVNMQELYQGKGVMYIPDEARFQTLVNLPEGTDIGGRINAAMEAIEKENSQLRDVLPKNYAILENGTLVTLLKSFNQIDMDIDGDVFGQIYEYFLSNFAMSEGQRGGEFFTPTSIVRLMVEILEPFEGRILDPACGSGGMFVQSARFVQERQQRGEGHSKGFSIHGQERVTQTMQLCKMNLAVHGLTGQIMEGNSYYDDPHQLVGRFDYVMANPPFNVNNVDKERLEGDPRYPWGMPRNDNGNYLWIQMFAAALSDTGRAGFVMANSASDARHSELDIRQKLVESGVVDVMVAVGTNFFYTVTLPCTLWFFDKGKVGTEREDQVLFIDARAFYRQVTRAVREYSDEQIDFLADIVRLYRGIGIGTEDREIPVDGGEVGGSGKFYRPVPRWAVRRCAGAVQSGHPRRN